jgi:hypothetical protein
MTSFKQMEANRRNALKSTGPRSSAGKQRSRCNALRHGLTAETVIGTLEDAEDYQAFEAAIIADYDAQSAVERELVLRLASLLWRLRRATTMETGLFAMQADNLNAFRRADGVHQEPGKIVYATFVQSGQMGADDNGTADCDQNGLRKIASLSAAIAGPAGNLTSCFLRLANLSSYPLDRLSRYEATLWRQAAQTLFALHALDRRKPQERRRGANLEIEPSLPE